ncbi:uncharacterized protein [Panulirus ornatus]|uniref:uncharacterized protein n=1 Tax=Panulirus ornatus TaxID=150431 RepID=UPI003A88EE5D
MTTTYRRAQPVHQPLMKDTFYSDYEVESGISKRVNCLVALTVVALIVGGAALGLSIMLVMQGMESTARQETSVAMLQQRLKHLERQVGIADSSQDVMGEAPSFREHDDHPGEVSPPAGEEATIDADHPDDAEHSMAAGHPHHDLDDHAPPHVEEKPPPPVIVTGGEGNEGVPIIATHENDDSFAEVGFTLVQPPHPGHDDDDDDDDDGFGSGDCPALPRPVCPIDVSICYTIEVCPVPVCCPVHY